MMNPTIGYVIAAIVVLVLLGLIAVLLAQRQRSRGLQQRFGPEYDRAVAQAGDARRAEAELRTRQNRVERLDIRPLAPDQRDGFARNWERVQAGFVDEPQRAIGEADALIAEVMRARGYPVGDFEERAADVSVDHAGVVSNYRAAHAVADRNKRGEASTEDLRQAMVWYRSLFSDLLETAVQERPVIHREEVKDDERTNRKPMGWGRR